MKQEVYRSSTLGEIPLSFTGRRLMANLRDALQGVLEQRRSHPERPDNWEPVSLARGRIAQYISKLEQRDERPRAFERNEEFDESRMTPDPNCDCAFCTIRKSMENEQNYGGWPFGTPTRNPFRNYDAMKERLAEAFIPKDGPRVRVHHVNSLEEAQKIMAEYEAGRLPPETSEPPPKPEPEPEPKSQVHEAISGSTYVLPDIPEGYVLRKVNDILEIVPMSAKEWQEIAGGDAEQPGKPEPHEVYELCASRMNSFLSMLNEYNYAITDLYAQPFGFSQKRQERIDKARMALVNAFEAVNK